MESVLIMNLYKSKNYKIKNYEQKGIDVYKREGYELYCKRWLQYAKNGWKKENDLVLKIGFDSSGLYDIGQEKGYGAAQNMWILIVLILVPCILPVIYSYLYYRKIIS